VDYLEETEELQENLVLIFRFLQLLCEGHNHDLQLYLRE
jgi:hypothetical protein